ncbi:N-acetylglucosamine-1-phosphodiester alpha-N-acetylglucosaminidase-like [Haliotis rufescens]|uniref:N-acetylglucosamine-1-phosphodiester alpha-N-acetylglucosaminidase-like n=1 Tax=Haliotis rufescens TaxID=6454 RepID=UPI00201F4FC6|nr:N-acetylglucosamine-1-phosphodiester alpha-N-acetylglucosaminidase-like [Haliotis rufescens]
MRQCQHIKIGNLTHSKHKANISVNLTLPLVESRHQLKSIGKYYYDRRIVNVLFQKVNNPLKTFSVLEPGAPGTCRKGSAERVTVRESAKQKHCVLAISAGFFNIDTGECYGNIYSDGRLVSDSGGVQNAHFGITADGYIFAGYLSQQDLMTHRFTQLVGGVIWLLKEGEIYVDESIKNECSTPTTSMYPYVFPYSTLMLPVCHTNTLAIPETMYVIFSFSEKLTIIYPHFKRMDHINLKKFLILVTLREFASIQKSRVAVGHDKDGRILIAHVDVAKGNTGVDLHEMASILLDLGFVNAINLDSGGSATTVINGTLVSHPSDECPDKIFNCERQVTTILCVHEPECDPGDCSGHGTCEMGVCECSDHRSGPACDIQQCSPKCNQHGSTSAGAAQELLKSQHQSDQYRSYWLLSVVLGIIAAVSIIINILLLFIHLDVQR